MAKSNFRKYNQAQGIFKVIVPDELLKEDDPARIISVVVDQLDLSSIYEYYSKEGNQPYHPRMMLKVLFYSYFLGIRSCRKIWDNLAKRADYIYLSGDQVPDFRTINDFRKLHIEKLPGIFAQIAFMCAELGLVDFKNLSIDGEKIKANANYKKSYNKKRLKTRYENVKKGIKRILAEEITDDYPEKMKKKRLKKLRSEKKKLEDLAEKLQDIEKCTINSTDEDAKVLKHKDGRGLPSYNHQSAVDSKHGITVAVNTTDESDKPEDFFGIVDKATENAGSEFKNISADSAFCNYENLEKSEIERTENYFLPDRLFLQSEHVGKNNKGKFDSSYFQIKRKYVYCPAKHRMEIKRIDEYENYFVTIYKGTSCLSCKLKKKCTDSKARTFRVDSREEYRRKMRQKLLSQKGKEIYRKRQAIVEPGNGSDQLNNHWIQHSLRGMKKASLEFMLIRIGSNLSKMIKYAGNEILQWQYG